MQVQKIVNYIIQRRKLNVSDQEIKQELLNAGWAEAEVVGSFAAVLTGRKKPISKKMVMAVIAAVLLIAAGAAAGYYFWAKNKTATSQTVQTKNEKEAADLAKQDQENKAASDVGNQPIGCDRACFEKKFAFCQKASTEEKLNEQLTVGYEILGVDLGSGRCKVRTFFVANPVPDYMGKEMICGYNQKLPFLRAITDLSKCSGELYLLLSGQQAPAKKPCTLKIGGTVEGNGQQSQATNYKAVLQKGPGFTSTKISASGYSAKPEQVSWRVENQTIAEIYQMNRAEAYVMIKPKAVGTTKVIAFDGAIGQDCVATVSFEVVSQ